MRKLPLPDFAHLLQAPDFKYKKGDRALWISSRGSPDWINDALMQFDAKQPIEAPGAAAPRPITQSNGSAPGGQYASGQSIGGLAPGAAQAALAGGKPAQWELFRASPNQFWDNRAKKAAAVINTRSPDFSYKRKEEGNIALWIDSKDTPGWVAEWVADNPPR